MKVSEASGLGLGLGFRLQGIGLRPFHQEYVMPFNLAS